MMRYDCDDYDDGCNVVFMHQATTGLGPGAHVMQIAAKCGRSIFNAYLLPWRPITPRAAEMTGFSRHGMDLYVCGQRKHTLTVYEAMQQFISFLRSLGGNVVLAAHNGYAFDARHLIKLAYAAGMWDDLNSVCVGFSDTLPLFRREYPYMNSHRLADLVWELLPYENYPLNNAVGHVRALDHLIDETGLYDAVAESARELCDL